VLAFWIIRNFLVAFFLVISLAVFYPIHQFWAGFVMRYLPLQIVLGVAGFVWVLAGLHLANGMARRMAFDGVGFPTALGEGLSEIRLLTGSLPLVGRFVVRERPEELSKAERSTPIE
jgi:hypothetical protein